MKKKMIKTAVMILFALFFTPFFVCAEPYYPSTGLGNADSPVTVPKDRNEIFAYTNWICGDQARDASALYKRGLSNNFDLAVSVPFNYEAGNDNLKNCAFGGKFKFAEDFGVNFGIKPYLVGKGNPNYSVTFLYEKNIGNILVDFNAGESFSSENHTYGLLNFGYDLDKKNKTELEIYKETNNPLNAMLKYDYAVSKDILFQIGGSYKLNVENSTIGLLTGVTVDF